MTDQINAKKEPFSRDDPILARMKRTMGSIAAMKEHIERKKYEVTPQAKLDKLREVARHEYPVITKALDKPLKEFFRVKGRNGETFPAVDLAAGPAYYTTQFSFRYRPPLIGGTLEWCPTDKEAETRTLRFLQDLATEANECTYLFTDANGDFVFRNDTVTLKGLARYEFNGREAVVLERDPRNNDRFSVQMKDKWRLRLKTSNLIKRHELETQIPSIEEEQQQFLSSMGLDKAIFDGLLERTTKVDLIETETWSNVSELKDRCAVVTCINLLRAIGEKEPEAWKNVLDLASRLLIRGGFLLQFDNTTKNNIKWGKYGNVKAMEDYVGVNSLRLKVQKSSIGAQQILIVWRKE